MNLPKTISRFTVLLALIISSVFVSNYSNRISEFYGDSFGYYLYLPSAIIYNNLQTADQLPADSTIPVYVERNLWILETTDIGHPVIQYTYGVAFTELPFFAIAHLYETLWGGMPNGFSNSYLVMIKLFMMVYAFLGLLVTYRVVRRYFPPLYALLSVILIYLGTNLFWFSVQQSGMSHTVLFFLYALLMWLTIKFHERPKISTAIGLGLLVGFIIITRPTDIVCVFIPLLYNVFSIQSFKEKVAFVKANTLKIVILCLVTVLPAIPQLLYWKLVSGKYIYYSYGSQQFDWKNPKIIEGIFGFQNGWLPYAPIMLFAIGGFFFWKRYKEWAAGILFILPLYIYIIYSWYCFNYINGLGSRPMLHVYPLLALPLAAFIQWVAGKRNYLKWGFAFICLFFIAVNYSFSMLQAKRMLVSDNANWQFCSQVLFRNKINYNDLVTYDTHIRQPDSRKLRKITTLVEQGFEDSVDAHYFPYLDKENNKYFYRVGDGEEYIPFTMKVPYDERMKKDRWLKASGNFLITVWANMRQLLVINIKRKDHDIIWNGCTIHNKIGLSDSTCEHIGKEFDQGHFELGKWGNVSFYTKIPDGLQPGDIIELGFWNVYKSQIYMDDLKLELYESK